MTVGVLRVCLRLDGCRSLKDKRQILRSLLETLRHDFKASVAEVGDHELWGNAEIGVAIVGADALLTKTILDKCLLRVEESPDVEVVGIEEYCEQPF